MVANLRVWDGLTDITPGLRGELRSNAPLADFTSWRVGGPVDRLYLPADLEDLIAFLIGLPTGEPLFWLGLGSNLLVRDGGLRGTALCTKGRLKAMRDEGAGRIYVEAGVPCAHVPKFCHEHRLVGAEFLAGIPGTIGGALAMNAGAFGGETWRVVERILTVDQAGILRWRHPNEYTVGYRSVCGPSGEWFAAAELRLETGDSVVGRERVRALLAQRNATQPTQQPSCGSVFRNPPGDHAARLIESCGLKGKTIGGAQVSEKHANFIVNIGMAKASHIEALLRLVQAEVLRVHGVELEPEVRIVGETVTRSSEGLT